ncbi:hypothetical protein HELRODRAFT_178528 [Helobdella robusta]|uniref:Uncharacterized protein n=1 Tax=Helobdella robusta TaxID=6412 RepID=T1FDB4_HELRO|nr:hypothetical protein HELRODRAFT_178528 [Helobdella robusta]ESN97079.1 hypothetical protein HELRODRAFT_178528 [Helobdella robusta]
MMQIHSNDVLANARSESLSVDDEDKDDVFDVIIKLREELLASDSDRFIQHKQTLLDLAKAKLLITSSKFNNFAKSCSIAKVARPFNRSCFTVDRCTLYLLQLAECPFSFCYSYRNCTKDS